MHAVNHIVGQIYTAIVLNNVLRPGDSYSRQHAHDRNSREQLYQCVTGLSFVSEAHNVLSDAADCVPISCSFGIGNMGVNKVIEDEIL
jgi:hypothetical protein